MCRTYSSRGCATVAWIAVSSAFDASANDHEGGIGDELEDRTCSEDGTSGQEGTNRNKRAVNEQQGKQSSVHGINEQEEDIPIMHGVNGQEDNQRPQQRPRWYDLQVRVQVQTKFVIECSACRSIDHWPTSMKVSSEFLGIRRRLPLRWSVLLRCSSHVPVRLESVGHAANNAVPFSISQRLRPPLPGWSSCGLPSTFAVLVGSS